MFKGIKRTGAGRFAAHSKVVQERQRRRSSRQHQAFLATPAGQRHVEACREFSERWKAGLAEIEAESRERE